MAQNTLLVAFILVLGAILIGELVFRTKDPEGARTIGNLSQALHAAFYGLFFIAVIFSGSLVLAVLAALLLALSWWVFRTREAMVEDSLRARING